MVSFFSNRAPLLYWDKKSYYKSFSQHLHTQSGSLLNDHNWLNLTRPSTAFTHRLQNIAEFGASFAGAFAEITGSKDQRYYEILVKILKECKDHVNDHKLMKKSLKESGIKVKSFVIDLPPCFDSILNDPSYKDSDKIVIKELAIAIKLLHDKPFDPTLALIAADRAIEIYLKSCLKVRKKKFPELVNLAREKKILNNDQIKEIKQVHNIRNKCQHEGIDVTFYDAVENIKKIIDIIVLGFIPKNKSN